VALPPAAAREVETALAGTLGLVALFEMPGCRLVVAGERFVRGVGYALFQRIEIEHSEQRVAAAHVGVQEAKRFARLDCLNPQRHLGQLDRQRVAIDPMNAGARDLAQRVAIVLGRGA